MLNVDDVDTASCLELSEGDSVLTPVDLPLRATFFPLGFPLEVSTNSSAVIATAEASWKHFRQKFTQAPLELRIKVRVDEDRGTTLPPTPVYSRQWDTLLCVADARNVFACDLSNGRSFGSITQS